MAARKFTVDALRNVVKNHGGRFDRVLEKVSTKMGGRYIKIVFIT